MLIIGPPLAFAGTIIPFVVQSIAPEQQQQSMTSGDADLSQVSPSLVGAGILALGWILMAIGIFLIYSCLWAIKRKVLGLEAYRNSVNHKHWSECNFNCNRQYHWHNKENIAAAEIGNSKAEDYWGGSVCIYINRWSYHHHQARK